MENDLDLLLLTVGNTRKKVYQNLEKDFSGIEPPSWSLLTAGFIRKNGFNVQILDANQLRLTHDETYEKIKEKNPKFVGIVNYGQQANTAAPLMTETRNLINTIKANDPSRVVVLSGWNPSALPELTLEQESCDYVIAGGGFKTYLGLVSGVSNKDNPGLFWRENGEFKNAGRAKNIENLTEELSEIPWDLVNIGEYRSFNWIGLKDIGQGKNTRNLYASMYTSLGCPFKCDFCAVNATYTGERKIWNWEPDWVLKQMDFLVENYGIKNLKINDEMFVFDENHYLPIAEGLLDRKRKGKYELNIVAFARVNRIKEENLPLLKEAGFNWFELGIESGNNVVMTMAHKNQYTREDIKQKVAKIHENGIDLCANFLFGLPGETWESMQDTLNLAFEMMPAFPSFFAAMAPPGSPLYQKCKDEGIKLPDSWIGYAQQSYEFLPISNENLSARDILEFRDYAFNAYFRNPAYLSTIEKKFGKLAKEHIIEMGKYDLKRKILE